MPFTSLQHWAVLFATMVAAASTSAAQSDDTARADEATLVSVRGCEIRYRVHRPAEAASGPAVLIGHGVMRNGDNMLGWAEAIADAGLIAVTLDFCASAMGDGKHADNGADLVALRQALRFDEVIYVGVSAGGLAALVAASKDSGAVRGLLLLDPVNAGGQARSAAGRITVPVAALVARPQMCNAWRNIDPALATLRDATIVPLRDASHCDFEWPTDAFCRAACVATGSRDRRDRAASRIRMLGVGFVRALAAGDPSELARWKGAIGEWRSPQGDD